MAGSADELASLLDLERLEVDLYRGAQARTERQRVFGGQVAAQAVVAATRSVESQFVLHSLHSYFLRPGDTTVPIVYDVERIRDGRSFVTRRVSARQHGRPIYYMTANFQIPEPGLEHQDRMPEVPSPEQGMPLVELARSRGPEAAEHWEREWAALDIRHVGITGQGLPEDPEQPARARLWIKVDGELAADPTVQQAAFTYASDLTLLGAALVPHGIHIASPRLQPASLDHTIWFHRPFRADEWWLYDQFSPFAGGARGLALARVFSQSGELVATVAQEGLIRLREPSAVRRGDAAVRSGGGRPTEQVRRAVLRVGHGEGPARVVLAGGVAHRARQEHRLLERHLDGDGVGQPVLDRGDRARQGPHAMGDLAREPQRPRGQRVEVDRVRVARHGGVRAPEIGGQAPLDATGRRVRQRRGPAPCHRRRTGRGAGRSRSTPTRSRRQRTRWW